MAIATMTTELGTSIEPSVRLARLLEDISSWSIRYSANKFCLSSSCNILEHNLQRAREDEFFDEDGNCCSQEISLEVVYEERIEQESLVEILGPRKWRIKI